MDPVMSAMLATHDSRSPHPDRDGLAWSALPHAPVIADPPPRASVAGHRLATALRRVADTVDGRRRVGRMAESNGRAGA